MFVDLNRLARQRCRKWMPKHRKVNYLNNNNNNSYTFVMLIRSTHEKNLCYVC